MESVSTGVTIYYNQSAPFLIRSFVHTTCHVDSARIRDKKFTGLLVTCKSTKFPLTHDRNTIIARHQKLCSPTEAKSYNYKNTFHFHFHFLDIQFVQFSFIASLHTCFRLADTHPYTQFYNFYALITLELLIYINTEQTAYYNYERSSVSCFFLLAEGEYFEITIMLS